jgi:hypothetical protein
MPQPDHEIAAQRLCPQIHGTQNFCKLRSIINPECLMADSAVEINPG